jgi:hypothetical protein
MTYITEMQTQNKKIGTFCPMPACFLELLSFANRFSYEEMKCFCDSHLFSIVENVEDALISIGLYLTPYFFSSFFR